ncbi:hypothetical protein [Sinomonas terrae]|jgi:multidrug efflux pump subunit AcrA (membrane-fusion protein)|uniref:Peptidoglycan-binding protein n=1 Tax=Sinomonas terrae TaxID=2908838 RepID=A0ABS9TX93_9MICC|nr:hypothetical protein [Sinomonas terrae]MCH6469042.1 hypothetical protein [Sinomonas terrae]
MSRIRREKRAGDPKKDIYRRLSRPWLVSSFALAVILSAVAGYAGAILIAKPSLDAERIAKSAVPVYAKAEKHPVGVTLTFQGGVREGRVVNLEPNRGFPSSPRVTAVFAKSGDPYEELKLLAVASGRPLITMAGSVPIYRDLRLGDKGHDVLILQGYLRGQGYRVRASGVMGSDSIRAVVQIYEALGLEAPTEGGGVIFRYSDFLQIEPSAGTIVNVAPVAQILDDKHPIAGVRVEPKFISSRVTVDQKMRLAVGDKLAVLSEKRRGSAQIVEIGPFAESTQTGVPAGHDVRIELPVDLNDLEPGQPVALSKTSTSELALAVPVLAIRTENGSGYVLRRSSEGEPDERVPIEVIEQAGGWAAIADRGSIMEGDEIRVE